MAEQLRVLVADDTRAMAALMRQILVGQGYEVAVAEDGQQCLELARSFRPDLILMDIMMPRVHGLEALSRLRADPETRSIGVIVCTAKDFKPDQDQARSLGAFEVLVKPFQKDELLRQVAAWFAGQGPAGRGEPRAEATADRYLPTIRPGRAQVRLWGTRGSIPVSGPAYARHGGNTSCMSVDPGDELIVLDAGSGIRELGMSLLAGPPRTVNLFITHTHWDHIQGFPFFAPAYIPTWRIRIYGAPGFGKDLKSVFRGQLDHDYFPVQLEDMRSTMEFIALRENPVAVGPYRVHWEYAHHPGAAVGYKVEVGDRRIAWLSDNEFLKGYLGDPETVRREGGPRLDPYQGIIRFLADADLAVAEAQYTNAEYPAKVGWGHSSVANACLLAALAGLPQWIVTHHDPTHTDELLDGKLALTRQVMGDLGHACQVRHGYDGMLEYL